MPVFRHPVLSLFSKKAENIGKNQLVFLNKQLVKHLYNLYNQDKKLLMDMSNPFFLILPFIRFSS